MFSFRTSDKLYIVFQTSGQLTGCPEEQGRKRTNPKYLAGWMLFGGVIKISKIEKTRSPAILLHATKVVLPSPPALMEP